MNTKRGIALTVVLVLALSLGVVASCKKDRPAVDVDAQAAGVVDFIIPTTQATATPGVVINNKSAGAVSLQVQAAGTPAFDVERAGAVDMKNNVIKNIGNAGTDFGSTGGLTLANGLTVTTGGATITAGGLTVAAGVFAPSFANLTVTDGDTITPTVTVYAIDTAGAVTATLAASASEGQLLILINDDANATIIADTNLRSSDGNAITLAGAYDVAVFVYQDSEWLLIATSANS